MAPARSSTYYSMARIRGEEWDRARHAVGNMHNVNYGDPLTRRLPPRVSACHRRTTSGCIHTAKSAVRAMTSHAKPTLATTFVDAQATRPNADNKDSGWVLIIPLGDQKSEPRSFRYNHASPRPSPAETTSRVQPLFCVYSSYTLVHRLSTSPIWKYSSIQYSSTSSPLVHGSQEEGLQHYASTTFTSSCRARPQVKSMHRVGIAVAVEWPHQVSCLRLQPPRETKVVSLVGGNGRWTHRVAP